MRTLIVVLARCLLAIILIGCASFYALFYTQFGLDCSIKIAEKWFPGKLQVTNSRGNLGSHFVLNNFLFSNTVVEVSIKQLEIAWNPFQLLKHNLVLSRMNANGVVIRLLPSAKQVSQDTFIQRFFLNEANLSDLTVYQNTKLITHVDTIVITHSNNEANQFIVKLPQGTISGEYVFNDLVSQKWHLVADADKVVTNYLWPQTDSQLSFHVTTAGEWNTHNKRMVLDMTRLSGNVRQFPLVGIVNLQIENKRIFLKNVDVTVGKSFVKLQGDIGDPWNMQWNIFMPNLNSINAGLTGSLVSSGKIMTQDKKPVAVGTLQAKQIKFKNVAVQTLDGKLFSALQANTVQLQLNGKQLDVAHYIIPQINILLNMTLSASKTLVNATAVFSKTNQVRLSFQWPNLLNQSLSQAAMQGNIILQASDLSQFITSTDIHSLQGALYGNVTLSGNLAHPRFQGYLNIMNGGFMLPALGIHPNGIQFHNTMNNDFILHINGKFSSNSGQGTLVGMLDLNKPDYVLNLNVVGSQLLIANLKEYRIIASPNINVTMQGSAVKVTGHVLLPYVDIDVKSYSNIVTLPSDFTYAGEKPPIYSLGNLSLGINLELGSYAHVDYDQLHADLAGSISVFQKPGGIPAGNGTLHVTKGTYQIYDKSFSINNGRLVYVGNLLTNPGLNIDAFQQLNSTTKNFLGFKIASDNDQIKAGVQVRGTLKNPIVQLVSNPPMSQDDILSHLVFNQSRSNISGLSALSLLGSASSGMNLGEPTLGDESNPPSGLMDMFKMGIFAPTQALNFDLPISKYWKIQSESSITEVGVDLLYSYETN
ncbi:MAG: translocation/assembly module TamB domain-containing protein [Gammaproteobacteria bacterium]|nr:translocation/assembly module TamB domain-containing protein [Gammaproteobacteria bacterium]